MYGAPTELATDGGQPFPSHDIQQFLCSWGVKWRQSSAYYPQSNGRAKLAVKTAKRILQNNTSSNGDLNTDNVARALLQYRNTPIQQLNFHLLNYFMAVHCMSTSHQCLMHYTFILSGIA